MRLSRDEIIEKLNADYTGRLRANLMTYGLDKDLHALDFSDCIMNDMLLMRADLRWSNLACASLRHAWLQGADLSGANLMRCDLSHAVLCGANLSGANLRQTRLSKTNLAGAILDGTILDPELTKHNRKAAIERGEKGVIGYRFPKSQFMDSMDYCVGMTYYANAMSWDMMTQCHPGLYSCPTVDDLVRYGAEYGLLRDTHRMPILKVVYPRGEVLCLEKASLPMPISVLRGSRFRVVGKQWVTILGTLRGGVIDWIMSR